MASYSSLRTSSLDGSRHRSREDSGSATLLHRTRLTVDDRAGDVERNVQQSWSLRDKRRTGSHLGGQRSDRLPRTVHEAICYLAFLFIIFVLVSSIIGLPDIELDEPVRADRVLDRLWSLKPTDKDADLISTYRAPDNVSVKALVFYGRRRTAAILHCFLERNLKRNGGLLDEVVWVQGTVKTDELAWMHSLVNATANYTTFYAHGFAVQRNYSDAYSVALNETHTGGETVYIKLDDDVVFMDDAAIPSVVHRLLTDPRRPFIVGANVVNQPALSWVHYSMQAIEGYMPELNSSSSIGMLISNSAVPPNSSTTLKSTAPLNILTSSAYDDVLPIWTAPSSDYRVPVNFTSSYNHSRWLPVNASEWPIGRTPIAEVEQFSAWGKALTWWPIGAQQHYSLLGRMARNDVSALKFDVWDFGRVRMGIQFFAVRRSDVVAHYPLPYRDDEHYFSVAAPNMTERRAIVDGRNVAAHYGFNYSVTPQHAGLDTTDVLQRYASFAERNICSSPAAKAAVRKESMH